MKKKTCIVTGSRAEYGLYYPLLKKMKKDQGFRLQIVASGMHLSARFGFTYKEIEHDGFRIDEKVKIPLEDDTSEGIAKAVGEGIIGFSRAFRKLKPDFVVVLGDRFETFAAAIAAFFKKIPIVHLHGGERTEGAVDEALRHSITKMSMLHFTSTEEYRRRVIQLGEDPHRVFTVGALGIDNIMGLQLLSKEQLEKELNFSFSGKTVLVTFHPATMENNTSAANFNEILAALDRFKEIKIIFTKPNADLYGKVISVLIDRYVKKNQGRAAAFTSLGRLKYLSALKYCDVVLGNSSSGIIEAPSLGKPAINVGDRQKGRIRARSVLQCSPKEESIYRVLKKAFSPKFRRACRKVKNPYGSGSAAGKIIATLKREIPKIKDTQKAFYDLEKPCA